MVSSSFSVNKEVIKDKLSFDVSLANPFTPFRHYRRKTVGNDFIQTNDRRDYFRAFSVNLNYKFGKLKESIKKNKRSIRNDDLQG
jgi:ferric enterobactin receptor